MPCAQSAGRQVAARRSLFGKREFVWISVYFPIMADNHITLWTMQSPGHMIDDANATLDTRRSHMVRHSPLCLHRKYEEVRHRVGTGQVLWCFTESPQWEQSTVDSRVRWTLRVPIGEVLTFVDEWLAERLAKGLRCPQASEWTKWRRHAAQAYPKPQDQDKQDEYIEGRPKSYEGPDMDPDGGWSQIFIPAERSANVSALLRFPVPSPWIIERPSVQQKLHGSDNAERHHTEEAQSGFLGGTSGHSLTRSSRPCPAPRTRPRSSPSGPRRSTPRRFPAGRTCGRPLERWRPSRTPPDP